MATTTINDSGMEDYGFDQDAQMYPIEDNDQGFRFAMFQTTVFDQIKHFAHPQVASMTGRCYALCNPNVPLMFVSAWSEHELSVCRACIALGREFVENMRRGHY